MRSGDSFWSRCYMPIPPRRDWSGLREHALGAGFMLALLGAIGLADSFVEWLWK